MTESKVAIIGSGIAGTTLAHMLTARGHDVAMFEIGPDCAYPHVEQFTHEVVNLEPTSSLYIPPDLRGLDVTGNYASSATLPREQVMVVGGMATRWGGWTPRYLERDFQLRTRHGYSVDWPISYADLEPYYCRAEALIGVSGTDDDNPLAPPRSKPYPLPPFELPADDLMFRDRLASIGLRLHTVPQARVSRPYDGRPACANFGVCQCCPIGARYSPNHHLRQSLATGMLTLYPNTAVRKIVSERPGRVSALEYYPGNGGRAEEHHAEFIVVAAGVIESARLLLLSSSGEFRDGLGNSSGHVGRNLLLHHIYGGALFFDEDLYPGRMGARTAQSYQLHDTDGSHGGFFKLDFTSSLGEFGARFPAGRGSAMPATEKLIPDLHLRSGRDVLDAFRKMIRARGIAVHTETVASDQKFVSLSNRRDRFGAPFAAVHHESTAFDLANRPYVRRLVDRLAAGTKARELEFDLENFHSGHHHLGTCRMAAKPADGVTDPHGRVHGLQNLFVAGASLFPTCSAANPTLTITALALRTGDFLLEQLQS